MTLLSNTLHVIHHLVPDIALSLGTKRQTHALTAEKASLAVKDWNLKLKGTTKATK